MRTGVRFVGFVLTSGLVIFGISLLSDLDHKDGQPSGQAPVTAGSPTVPGWRDPAPGTKAFLGDDGGDADTATVCDTAQRWRDWLNAPFPDVVEGCSHYPRGTPIVIEEVASDAESHMTATSNTIEPLVKISIPSKEAEGYVQMLGSVHPDIPTGTIAYTQGDKVKLAPRQDSGLDVGIDLSAGTELAIMKYDPSIDGPSLFVDVTNGPNAGKSGWLYGLDVSTLPSKDGEPVEEFHGAVKELAEPIPPVSDASRAEPASPKVWHGTSGWQVSWDQIPGSEESGCFAGRDGMEDHHFFLSWDNVHLSMAMFMAAPPRFEVGAPTGSSPLVVSVDGKVVARGVVGFGLVEALPEGTAIAIPSTRIAWDQNNEGHDAGLETAQVLERLSHGHRMTERVFGKTFSDDLVGFAQIPTLLKRCLNYSAR